MFTVTNAQDSYPFYDFDTATLEIRLANPHLTAAATRNSSSIPLLRLGPLAGHSRG